jgi:hypothetical protein
MTIGYVGTDWLIAARFTAKKAATTQESVWGPHGLVRRRRRKKHVMTLVRA